MQKTFVEIMLNRLRVNSSSDIPVTPVVELDPREEGEPKGGCVLSDVAGDHDTVRYLERGACHGAPFPQPNRQALEISSEDHGIPRRDKGYGIDFCEGFGIGFDRVE